MNTTITLTDIAIGLAITTALAVAVGVVATIVMTRRDCRSDARIAAARKRFHDAAEAPDTVAVPDDAALAEYLAERERQYEAQQRRWLHDQAEQAKRKRHEQWAREWAEKASTREGA
ncbi:hypothetical protein [Haloechinothrix salitolerans]|uniref:Uncharacterized protein n=1 Tax=Haloechinothrix salitolerans TaxID=926830 RepID=A0ABW2BZ17_9PSEU